MNGLVLLKAAHVLSAAIIFGTGLGIAFFTWFGYRSAMREKLPPIIWTDVGPGGPPTPNGLPGAWACANWSMRCWRSS